MPTPAPLVSALLAVRDGERFVGQAVTSILLQTLRDLELVVVDDGSTDETPEILAGITDERIVIVRNDASLGLAGALNRGVDVARGAYVARIDADDVALPDRLERQVAALRADPSRVVVGSGVVEFGAGRGYRVHRMPRTDAEIRWAALFSSPFLHPTVTIDRRVFEEHGLRYDREFGESEDYDLWTRALRVGTGANLDQPLVLYRRHPQQATERRGELQLSLRHAISLREIGAVAPALTGEKVELAWRIASGLAVPPGRESESADALCALAAAFGERGPEEARAARASTARALARCAARTYDVRLAARALALDPAVHLEGLVGSARRTGSDRRSRGAAERWLGHTDRSARRVPPRVTVVSPEPTPYRSGLLDRLAARDDLELTVVYASGSVQGRTWTTHADHPSVVLEGRSLPGARAILRHDYPLTTDVFRVLRETEPDVVVVSGWSTFTSQAAVAWCRGVGLPYVLLVESNDRDRRPGWRRAVKGAVADPVIRRASWIFVVGSLARASVIARGADPARVSVFANTVDVEAFGAAADALAPRRAELRHELGLGEDDVVVLCVARLSPEKGIDTLLRAVGAVGDPRLVVLLAGAGPERERLVALAGEVGARLVLAGDVPWERIAERYVVADVFALLSTHEPWGVVVNEAAASGLPLVLSDRVGAAYDLLVDGENGALVPAGDVPAAAAALARLAADPALRARQGVASRALVAGWGYDVSVESFVAGVRAATAR